MAVYIQDIVERIAFKLGKRDTGYFSPSEIIKEVNAESKNLFNHFIERFAKTRRISEHIQPFMVEAPVTITTGSGPLPADFKHANLVLSGTTPVKILELAEWGPAIAHVNHPPSAEYPICKFDGTTIQVRPTTIVTVDLHYFKTPVDAVYAWSVSGNRYLYDDGSSVDLEWREQVHDLIINRSLANLGVSIKDGDIISYSELERKEEAGVL